VASQVFRAGVGLVIRHRHDDLVLAFERVDAPGQWQLPQGGIHLDEEPGPAAWRELHEETGLNGRHVALAGEHPRWTVYEWPPEVRDGARRGQAQRWFFFDALEVDLEPQPDGREFGAWRWVSPSWLVEHVVAFRRDVYAEVLAGEFPAL
jgi:putative (di)nucleoside polyphosphate hydrolase